MGLCRDAVEFARENRTLNVVQEMYLVLSIRPSKGLKSDEMKCLLSTYYAPRTIFKQFYKRSLI